MKRAVIVIPTYDEAGNVKELIPQIFTVLAENKVWETHVLVVDSQSQDKTQEEVKQLQKDFPNLHLLVTPKEGLGKAYVKGFQWAINNLQPYLLFEMDADLSHNPKHLPAFFEKIEKGADIVLGSRYIKGGSIPSNWGAYRKFLSIVGNQISRLGFMKLSISDWTGGMRAIKLWVAKAIIPEMERYTGYVFQVSFLDKALKLGARISETPIQFTDRKKGLSKINSVEYMAQTLLYILGNSSFIRFVIVGLIGFVVDFGFAFIFINGFRVGNKALANMFSAEIAIVSNFLWNNFWVFSYKKISGGAITYLFNFLKFNFVSLGSILIQGLGMFLLLRFVGDHRLTLLGFSFNSWIIYKVAIIALVIIPYSYILYNKVVWKKK